MSNPQGALKHEGKQILVRRSEIAPKTKRKACNIGGLVETAYILRTGTHLRTGNFTHLRTDTANKRVKNPVQKRGKNQVHKRVLAHKRVYIYI